MNTTKIIIADDHTMFLEGIMSLLNNVSEIEIVGKAVNGKEVLLLLEKTKTDIIVLDISMPEMDGIEVTKIIKKKYSNLKILILSTHSNSQMIAKLIRIGIDGYLLKNAEKDELLYAIQKINLGETYFSKEVAIIHNEYETNFKQNLATTTELSNREKEILILIAKQYTAAEIAEKTFISLNTVNTHKRNLLSKLNVKNTAGLVKYAIELGLLD
ncbi:response regulator transcription factor [Flavobacterium sediminilitoris]|uniref:Response regulator transcription factor n=1 Tax=Flavobacterium sediminilitoris TaxID=2024526 RepID=A0ABY4HQB3_9FLAO|nr:MULTISPECIES: response regulator transcription factor [Flavobacterium]UOX34870.1 response regulator transcription factor [Flavobacterium sediminilitoris]